MPDIRVRDILKLLPGELKDGTEASKHFRALLEEKVEEWSIEDYRVLLQECLQESKTPSFHRAFQDLLISLGKKLGFQPLYGRYAGKQGEIGVDGIWKFGGNIAVLLEIKSSTWPGVQVSQLGDYMNIYGKESTEVVYGVYILGEGDPKALIEQIQGSDYRSRMRLINYQDLLDLIKIAENLEPTFGEAEAASKVRNILLPLQAIDVGNLVRLITSITEVKEPEEPGTIVVVPDGEVPWAESELAKYLKDSTPYQRVLFSALASETRPITTAQLLVLMNDIAKNKSSEKIGKTIGGFDIAGARGGLKMRRKGFKPMREDVLLVKKDEVTGERTYQIRPTYLDQIQLWLRGEGLL